MTEADTLRRETATHAVLRVLDDLNRVLSSRLPPGQRYLDLDQLYRSYGTVERKAMTEAMMARLSGATI